MSDREMLELAAKAAGSDHLASRIPGFDWDPLADDGDALRLAVKLRILGDTSLTFAFIEAEDCADIRRIIVGAAAEIGKAMIAASQQEKE